MGRELFLIADIGGYTRFLRDQSLEHAQGVVAKLLEAILDAAPPFLVEKLEGDAVFLHLGWPSGSGDPGLMATVRGMRDGFLAAQRRVIDARRCACDGCMQADHLTLKFVTHAGEAARQKVGPFMELAGIDVVLVHRMLKNDVPRREYVLGSERVLPLLGSAAARLDHDFESLGRTATWFVDLSGDGGSAAPSPAGAKETVTRAMLALQAARS